MNGFLQDLRYATRQLLSKPGFTAIVVLTLALGIGTNTAIFSVVYGIVFRPLPYPEAHQIMQLAESANGDTDEMDVTYSEFHFLRDRSGSAFASFAAFTAGGFNSATSRDLERINGLQVSMSGGILGSASENQRVVWGTGRSPCRWQHGPDAAPAGADRCAVALRL